LWRREGRRKGGKEGYSYAWHPKKRRRRRRGGVHIKVCRGRKEWRKGRKRKKRRKRWST